LQRLGQLEVVDRVLGSVADRKPSEVSIALDAYSIDLLIQVMVWTGEERSQLIRQYLTEWSQVRAPLDGRDLQALGYPQGVTYKTMLQDLLGATRDGVVVDRQSALDFLHRHHPR
jgi:tRNA nucleotidyltransferase (CCA-adding enzyme)